MQRLLFTAFLTLGVVSTLGINPFDYNPADEEKEVCYALKFKNDVGMQVNIQSGLSYEEMIWLAVWNMKFDFQSGLNELKFSKIKWRIPIIEKLFQLFKAGCSTEFVPHSFLNVLQQLILIYYNSEGTVVTPPANRWTNTLITLDRCLNDTSPLMVEGSSVLIDSLQMRDESVPVLPPHEVADDKSSLDLIIDSFWWIFSHSFGTCYSPATYRSSWAPRYKKLFYEDFIVPLLGRWGSAGPLSDFGFIFGNYDIQHILLNIRMCVTSAYTKLGIADRQLIRPYSFSLSPNFKTGDVAAK